MSLSITKSGICSSASDIAPQSYRPVRPGRSHKWQLAMTRNAHRPLTGLLPVPLAVLHRRPLVQVPYADKAVDRAGQERIGRSGGDGEASDGFGVCFDRVFRRAGR